MKLPRKIAFISIFGAIVACDSTLAFAEESGAVTTHAVQTYARQLSTHLVGRPLSIDERAAIEAKGQTALVEIVTKRVADPFFAKSFRTRIEMLIGSSGERDGVDFNLPGNLAEYVVTHKLPFGEILTADYCVDEKGQRTQCDTGAPFAAGVIGTRGYLKAHAGRFNLGRANALMGAFACTHYPMSPSLQPYIKKQELIPNFRIASEAEAKAAGSTGFGNGSACYSCHGQFSAHTQMFVKFDANGNYKGEATGQQSQTLEFGRSDNDLYVSHFVDKPRAASEAGNMFGEDIANLAEGMKVFAKSSNFMQCMVKQVVVHAFNLDSEKSNSINPNFTKNTAASIGAEPASVGAVYVKVLTDPEMIKAFARGLMP